MEQMGGTQKNSKKTPKSEHQIGDKMIKLHQNRVVKSHASFWAQTHQESLRPDISRMAASNLVPACGF